MSPAHLADTSVRIETERTVLALASENAAAEVVRYYSANRVRFEPVDPLRPPIFYEASFWRAQLRRNVEEYVADRSLRLFVFSRDDPERIIGNVGLSNFVRGVGDYCTLGYSIDGEHEGKGLMIEALRGAIAYAFGPLHFHRIEASHLPDNERSGALLRRLGFAVEGYSPAYLRINGAWRDHIRTALINPHWRDAPGD